MVYKYWAVMHWRPKIATQSFVKKIRQEEAQQEVFNVNKIMSVQEFWNNIEISFIEDYIPKIKKRENENEWVVNTRSKRVHNWECTRTVDIEIIGIEPSLARLLTALWPEFYCWNWIWHAEKISNNYENRKYVCQRKLLKDSWEDATLFDQSEETQNAIALLMWRNAWTAESTIPSLE